MSNHSPISCRPVLRLYFQDNEIKSYPDADWVAEFSQEGVEVRRWNVRMIAGIEWQT